MTRVRALAAIAALALIAAGSFQPMYFTIWRASSRNMATAFEALPYRRLPGFKRLLDEAAHRIPPHSRVGLWVPYLQWDGGYGYAFHRAPYVMPAHDLVPLLVDDVDRPSARYLATARYVVCWHPCPPFDGFTTTWKSPDGELMERRR